MSTHPPSETVDLVGDVESIIQELSRLIEDVDLPPQIARTQSSLMGASGQLANNHRALETKVAEMAARIAALSAELARLKRIVHGSQSEKTGKGAGKSDDTESTDADDTDAAADDTDDTTRKRHPGGKPGRTKKRGNAVTNSGLRFSDKAPVVDIHLLPPEADELSPDEYEIVGERVVNRLATLEHRYVVMSYHHATIKIHETGSLQSAPACENVFKNSCVDVSFIASMLIDKYLWHLPLYRQHRILTDAGIIVNRGSLTLWVNRAIALLRPIHDAQWRSVLESDIIQMDETPIRAGRNPGSPGSMKRGFLWPVLGDRGEVVFPFSPTRAHGNVPDFLGEYTGILVTDGYAAYDAYVKARDGAVTQQNCWIHTRRHFWEQKDAYQEMAGAMLDMIAELYKIEDEICDLPASRRLEERQTRSRAVVTRIWTWCEQMLKDPALTPQHPIRKAIQYAIERKATLGVFLSDPDVPLDTNLIENKIRGPKLGQRNWLFAFTEVGAVHNGIIYGLLVTCQMQGIDPRTWLIDVLLRIATHPDHRVEELTPRVWKTLFADAPMTSDVTPAVQIHADSAGPG